MAQNKGVHIRWKPMALDAFVFIVNTNNPVMTLTVEQIRATLRQRLEEEENANRTCSSSHPFGKEVDSLR